MDAIATVNVGMSGQYQVEKARSNPDGTIDQSSRTVLASWFDNLITDTGLKERANNPFRTVFNTCYVGSGNSTPAFSDNSLQSLITSATAGLPSDSSTGYAAYAAYVAGPPPYTEITISYTFAAATAEVNYSELGIGRISTALFSRALIKNTSGDPTTITLLSGEILIVTYKLRVYPPTTDSSGSFTLMPGTSDEIDINYTIRPSEIDDAETSWPGQRIANDAASVNSTSGSLVYYPASSTIGASTGSPSGTGSGFIAGNSSAGIPDTNTALVGADLEASNMNLAGGLGAIVLATAALGRWQIGFSPAVPKNADRTFSYRIIFTAGRYTP